MSNIISIETLAGKFANEIDLQEYCDKQYKIIQKITEENKKLKEDIDHLKFILASNTETLLTTSSEPIKIIVSKEQALLEEQINIIQNRSIGIELTLEDTKKLDLLLKNLNLIKESSPKTYELRPKKIKAHVDGLLEIASKKIEEIKPSDESI